MVVMFITSTLVSRGVIYQGLIHTEWFTGPQQFVIQQLVYFTLDLYFMMYCPYKWIRKSVANTWAGWTQKKMRKREKYFYFVRKPDPTEELKRKGYLKDFGQIAK